MPQTATFTHKGWFWFCPILAFGEAIDDETALEFEVMPRWQWLEWLFVCCHYLDVARIWVSSLLDPDYEPMFMFRLQRLETPITVTRP